MLIVIKLLFIATLVGVFYQDVKERKVYLWLLIVSIALFGFLHFRNSFTEVYATSVLTNVFIVFIIVAILFLYARFKLNLSLHESFGLGDLLFFLAVAVGFPTLSFIVLFSFSLLFSLVLFLITKKQLKNKTVPLAGFQALFLALIFLLNWTFNFVNLYQY